ncbi:hypothetical protein AB0I81_10255 [Nonomuraea sp. NPDC050404]|uniref:hypothetical protein n=1 Tax=Nonomuraea sp. NPDC050404 TaxID=3155783 RepID=UPI0033E25939
MQVPVETGLSKELLERLIAADERPSGPEEVELFSVVEEIRGKEVFQRTYHALGLPGYVPGKRVMTGLTLVVTASWPYLVNLALWPLPWEIAYRHSAGNLFALGAVVICITTLSVVWFSYGTAMKVGGAMSELVAVPEERVRLREWLVGGFDWWKQFVVSLPLAAVGVVLAVIALGDQGGSWSSRILLFLMGAWLGFLTGNILYWLLAGARIPGRLMKCGRLRMAWIDPASTPAIRDLCRSYAFVAAGLAVTVLVSEVVAAVYASRQQSEVAADVVVALPVIMVLVALYVGVWPYVMIARLVRNQIDLILHPMRAQLREPPPDLLTSPGFDELVKVYQYFGTLRTLPIKTSALLQYVAGIAASLLVFFVQRYLTSD